MVASVEDEVLKLDELELEELGLVELGVVDDEALGVVGVEDE